MKKTWLLIGVMILIAAVSVLWFYQRADARDVPQYRLAKVERGDLQSKVSATGTLSAVTTVSVGTQVSGQISDIFADFNDHVRKGQLLARIDPTLAQQAVADAAAQVESRRAQLDAAVKDYQRNRTLLSEGLIAPSAFDTAQSAAAVAKANLRSAEVSLDKARKNLSYTNIYAPIDGVVVERNVDRGQTVAASLSAPQLFLIANDLARMEILASVDESDIGQIEQGQTVTFTVQSMPQRTFEGTVKQVRLQSKTQENVVNYTVVISVENPDGKLLPGMTANVEFLVKSAEDVLIVPNAALRFQPSQEVMDKFRQKRMQERQGGPPGQSATGSQGAADRTATGATGGNGTFRSPNFGSESAGGSRRGAFGGGAPGATGGRGRGRGSSFGLLWYLDENGELTAAPVRTGITDGSMTEVKGKLLKEGMEVVVGSNQPAAKDAANPFQMQSGQQRPRFGAGF